MNRFFFLLLLVGLSGTASAQTSSRADSSSAEARARDDAFANWKTRYADNRAEVGREIKAVRQEIARLDSAQTDLKTQLTDLLNGSVKNWNTIKTDYADPQQFADCMAVFAVIRRAIQDGALRL